MSEHRKTDFQQADAFIRTRFSLAQVIFGLITFAVALILASQLGSQAKFFDNLAPEKQPGLWPALSIAGMLAFGFFQILQYWFSRTMLTEPGFTTEAAVWLRALEFVVWFMVYVAAVPVIGYLPATLVFAVLLTLRLGYRGRRMLGASLLCGIAVVLLFKSFLQVKIPGGMIYEGLPPALRNFMILYF